MNMICELVLTECSFKICIHFVMSFEILFYSRNETNLKKDTETHIQCFMVITLSYSIHKKT